MTSAENTFHKKLDKLKQKLKNDIDWEDEGMKEWKMMAEEKQAFYSSTLGSKVWEEYSRGQEVFLRMKIGFCLYGPTEDLQDEVNDSLLPPFYKDPEKQKTIEKLSGLIEREWRNEKLHLSFLYLIGRLELEDGVSSWSEFPVVRVLRGRGQTRGEEEGHEEDEEEEVIFIDAIGRVYRDWPDFLKNNDFPKCVYCYPLEGRYEAVESDGRPRLGYGRSPRGKLVKRLTGQLDSASRLTGLGSGAVLVAGALIPVAAPVITVAAVAGITTSAWSTLRSLQEMSDRKKHSQPLSLSDPEGRLCWLNLATGLLGAASASAVQYSQLLARNGRLGGRILSLLDLSQASLTSLTVLNHLVTLLQTYQKMKNTSQLVLSILFFCHCSISLKTAEEIIMEIEHKINLSANAQLTKEQRDIFASLLFESKKAGLLQEDKKIVKTLKIIKNKDMFFKEFGNGDV